IGLQYHDTSGEMRFHGVAEIDVDGAHVQYHRQFPRNKTPPSGTLPVPNDCTAIYFAEDAMWFATKSGAARLLLEGQGTRARSGERFRVYTENDGLESELLRDIVGGGGPREEVMVASDRGVGAFDGRHWNFSKAGPLTWRARALSRDAVTGLYVATDH